MNMAIKTSDERFHFNALQLLEEINEQTLPNNKVGSKAYININLDISLSEPNNQLYRSRLVQYLKSISAIKQRGKPKLIEIGMSGTSLYQVFRAYTFTIDTNFSKELQRLRIALQNAREIEPIYSFKYLVLNVERGTLQYKNNKPVHISISSQPIQLLILLLKSKGNILKYREILRQLDARFYTNSNTDMEVAKNAQTIRRDLAYQLNKAGVLNDELQNYIVAVTRIGYKLASE